MRRGGLGSETWAVGRGQWRVRSGACAVGRAQWGVRSGACAGLGFENETYARVRECMNCTSPSPSRSPLTLALALALALTLIQMRNKAEMMTDASQKRMMMEGKAIVL